MEGRGGAALHQIDPDRVAQLLAARENWAGYSRLRLMLTAVLPRLVGEAPAAKSD